MSELKELLLERSNAEPHPTTNPHEDFRVRVGSSLIVGYTSGKIVAYSEAGAKAVGEAIRGLVVEAKDYEVLIGSDEAGKGEWLGPMTVAAVAFTTSQAVEAAAIGVMDSKGLNVSRIVNLAEGVKKFASDYDLIVIGPLRFTELLEKAKAEGKNLNDILAWAHAKAIGQVHKEISQRFSGNIKVVIDEFDRIRTEERLRRVMDLNRIVLVQSPRAEEEMAVAAAGILARAEWEHWVDNESKRLGLDLRKITRAKAKVHEEATTFAKISYL